jgi:hypothetical protein
MSETALGPGQFGHFVTTTISFLEGQDNSHYRHILSAVHLARVRGHVRN